MAYDKNDTARFSLTVTDPFAADAAVDPTSVVFKTKINSTTTTYTYGVDEELIRTATGSYYIDIALSTAGTWYWHWQTSGTYAGVTEGSVVVTASQFT